MASARAPASFQPRATLVLIYFFALFFGFALLLVAPTLVSAYRELPPGPARDDLELASRIARESIRGRLGLALGAAALATAAGTCSGRLPGLRRR